MKKTKNVLIILLAVFVLGVFASGCSEKMTPEKLDSLPTDYNIENAEKDGFIVINSKSNDTQNKEIENFIKDALSGKNEGESIYIINENKEVTVFTGQKVCVSSYVFDIKENCITENPQLYFRWGERTTENGDTEFYVYSTKEDVDKGYMFNIFLQDIFSEVNEKTVYFHN